MPIVLTTLSVFWSICASVPSAEFATQTQRLFLAAANGDRPSVVDDLQRTQDAEFHAGASF
jgi:hypothetical protein